MINFAKTTIILFTVAFWTADMEIWIHSHLHSCEGGNFCVTLNKKSQTHTKINVSNIPLTKFIPFV